MKNIVFSVFYSILNCTPQCRHNKYRHNNLPSDNSRRPAISKQIGSGELVFTGDCRFSKGCPHSIKNIVFMCFLQYFKLHTSLEGGSPARAFARNDPAGAFPVRAFARNEINDGRQKWKHTAQKGRVLIRSTIQNKYILIGFHIPVIIIMLFFSTANQIVYIYFPLRIKYSHGGLGEWDIGFFKI